MKPDRDVTLLAPNRRQPGRIWPRRGRDAALRGIFRRCSGMWAVRFTCGARHTHQEKIGPLKRSAVEVCHAQRKRAERAGGWCPDR